jgi:hypothetical protein
LAPIVSSIKAGSVSPVATDFTFDSFPVTGWGTR